MRQARRELKGDRGEDTRVPDRTGVDECRSMDIKEGRTYSRPDIRHLGEPSKKTLSMRPRWGAGRTRFFESGEISKVSMSGSKRSYAK